MSALSVRSRIFGTAPPGQPGPRDVLHRQPARGVPLLFCRRIGRRRDMTRQGIAGVAQTNLLTTNEQQQVTLESASGGPQLLAGLCLQRPKATWRQVAGRRTGRPPRCGGGLTASVNVVGPTISSSSIYILLPRGDLRTNQRRAAGSDSNMGSNALRPRISRHLALIWAGDELASNQGRRHGGGKRSVTASDTRHEASVE